MIKIALILSILAISADERPEKYTVIAESGLNLRESSSLTSEVYKKLPFGSVETSELSLINYPEDVYVKDTINGIIGFWVDAMYDDKGSEINGYVFSPYIRRGLLELKTPDEKPIRITYEGLSCTELDYYPGLNWYGLYERHNTYELKSIDVNLRFGKWNEAESKIEYELVEDMAMMIETSEAERSSLLIGINDSITLNEGLLSMVYSAPETGYTRVDNNGFVSPGEILIVDYEGVKYQYEGIEKIRIGSAGDIHRIYDILLSQGEGEQARGQFMSNGLATFGRSSDHEYFQTPQIKWIGDLNGDNKLDFILYEHTMTEGCGVCWTRILFFGESDSSSSRIYDAVDEAMECNCED